MLERGLYPSKPAILLVDFGSIARGGAYSQGKTAVRTSSVCPAGDLWLYSGALAAIPESR
jgi:hypothetical protein